MFREELIRNIRPTGDEIRSQYAFLKENLLCSESEYERLVATRLMAAYEQGVNEYLHPPIEMKQANLKGELIHIGSITESLLSILTEHLVSKQKIEVQAIEKHAKYWPNRAFTFYQLINIIRDNTNFDKELLRNIDELRHERNKVHLAMEKPTERNEMIHEEYRVAKLRRKLDLIVTETKKIALQS